MRTTHALAPSRRERQEDSRRLLTPLGRKQAELTGRRLGGLVRGVNEQFGPCRVRVVRVSDLARAKETADIIYESMDLGSFGGEVVGRAEPDPLLNEGRWVPMHIDAIPSPGRYRDLPDFPLAARGGRD